MGLSPSQAKLLTLTSRIHDNEFQAQQIMSQKVALATREDAAYQEYNTALDTTKIQVAFANGATTKYIDATYANVCGFDETGNRKSQYSLIDAETGRMIVEDEVYTNYENFSNDKYSFAWSMLGFVENDEYSDFSWGDNWGNNIGPNANDGDITEDGNVLCLMTDAELEVYMSNTDDENLKSKYEKYQEALSNGSYNEQKTALKEFRDELYSNNARIQDIYDYMRLDKTVEKEECLLNKIYVEGFPEDFDETSQREFQYYLNLFEGIQNAGGCVSVSHFSEGYSNDNDWFNTAINSGKALLNIYNATGAHRGWQETSVATSTNENYLKENQDDALIKKAEAKYEHELNQIKRIDAQHDRDLNNLETERNALTKEKESVQKVMEDNIDRTFKTFS